MHAMGFNSVFAGDVCFCKAKQSKAKEVFDEGAKVDVVGHYY